MTRPASIISVYRLPYQKADIIRLDMPDYSRRSVKTATVAEFGDCRRLASVDRLLYSPDIPDYWAIIKHRDIPGYISVQLQWDRRQ